MIRFYTAGESHNKAIAVFLEGIPAGVKISTKEIEEELLRRKKGYGRGQRQSIEKDKIEIISGIRYSETIGSPICILVHNEDYREEDFVGDKKSLGITIPRPGHADLTGILKFLRQDIKDISERASARETVGRVVAGSICKQFLKNFDVFIGSFVVKIMNVEFTENYLTTDTKLLMKYHKLAENSPVRFPDETKEKQIMKIIDDTKNRNDTLGGDFVVFAINVPVGLGSHTQWDQRLNAKISYYLASIPAVKSVEVGLGSKYSNFYGSEVHDAIYYTFKRGLYRKTNNAGGIEGGISNGEPIIVRCTMKSIPTLYEPLDSVDIKTKKSTKASVIRSDICAVSSCSIIAESMLAICLANEFKIKFGGDSIKEIVANYKNYLNLLKENL